MPNELIWLLTIILVIAIVVFRDEVIVTLISVVLFLIGLGWLGLILGILFVATIGIIIYSVIERLRK